MIEVVPTNDPPAKPKFLTLARTLLYLNSSLTILFLKSVKVFSASGNVKQVGRGFAHGQCRVRAGG